MGWGRMHTGHSPWEKLRALHTQFSKWSKVHVSTIKCVLRYATDKPAIGPFPWACRQNLETEHLKRHKQEVLKLISVFLFYIF